ncbi:very short patch repair endonuclease [Jiangella ureilytica]|uniref:Very short patch repair endonuclease n=1 Tax=Jiangella ureilytica TaxID=2530374 RepID=A0A4R4RQE2_9ACTN|nr:very short patch repair endonuclease [Jiangella ureilytica]TDC52010.1 very short patch repair endonuclease [Jiangella ureilytica]
MTADRPTRPSTHRETRAYRGGLTSVGSYEDLPEVAPATRRTMQANRGRDTGPEMALRSILHARGLRFRVCEPLPFDRRRRADVTFTRVGLYVFVDGCFWHGCSAHFVVPKTRTAFWLAKVQGNQARDADSRARLEALGGTVLRFWEHESPAEVADVIEQTYLHLKV